MEARKAGSDESPDASSNSSLWNLIDRKLLRNQKRQSGANQQFTNELRRAAVLMSDKSVKKEEVWRHLERAHILGQASPIRHTAVHVIMFSYAVLTRDIRECFGQMLRVVLAAPSSLFGFAPPGNSGRTKVGLFSPMPVPADIRKFLE